MATATIISDTFLTKLRDSELVPITPQTDTDYVVSGGITVALRKFGIDYYKIEVAQLPQQASIMLPYPDPALAKVPGGDVLKDIFETMVVARRVKVDSSKDEIPADGLINTIAQAILFTSPPVRAIHHRVTVLASSTLTRRAIFAPSLPENRRIPVLEALQPLLDLVPSGGSRLQKVGGNLVHPRMLGFDYALLPNTFSATGGRSENDGPIERLKTLHQLEADISAFGIFAEPIIQTIAG